MTQTRALGSTLDQAISDEAYAIDNFRFTDPGSLVISALSTSLPVVVNAGGSVALARRGDDGAPHGIQLIRLARIASSENNEARAKLERIAVTVWGSIRARKAVHRVAEEICEIFGEGRGRGRPSSLEH